MYSGWSLQGLSLGNGESFRLFLNWQLVREEGVNLALEGADPAM